MSKRFEIRRLAGVPMEVISAKSDLPLEFVTFDLSPRGAYLMSDAVPKVGEQIVCSFHLYGADKPFCFFGAVTRVNRGRRRNDAGPLGFGVTFLDATARERLSIRSCLRGQPLAFQKPGRWLAGLRP
ncbi:MAG: PilZ domain-containing protein [Proteobacteria bacterium]|jgi:hypothetical protein|nr:PilZ domain-containing protein [Pseudomonadota bacterium]